MDSREKIEAMATARLERSLKTMLEKTTLEHKGFLGVSVDVDTIFAELALAY